MAARSETQWQGAVAPRLKDIECPSQAVLLQGDASDRMRGRVREHQIQGYWSGTDNLDLK